VQRLNRQTTFRKNLRRIIAVGFLVFLLAEWGSHGLAFAHSASSETEAVHAQHGAHEDLCKTIIRCPEGSRQELPPPSAGHDVVQQNLFPGRFERSSKQIGLSKDPRHHRSRLSPLYRAVSPPFHPPELSSSEQQSLPTLVVTLCSNNRSCSHPPMRSLYDGHPWPQELTRLIS
jgi:hypothetical protein